MHAPDVALVDLRMPGMSGTDVARAVRARYPHTRVVILSAYGDQRDRAARDRRRRDRLRDEGQLARGDRARDLPRGRRRADAAGDEREPPSAALAGLALLAPARAAALPASWTIADRGPRGGAIYAGTPVDGVGALYLPAGVRPGRRLRVAYLLAGSGSAAGLARRLGLAAAGDQLSWQRTTPPFAVVITSARGRARARSGDALRAADAAAQPHRHRVAP